MTTAGQQLHWSRTVAYPRHKARLAEARKDGCGRCGTHGYLIFHHREPVTRSQHSDQTVSSMSNHSDTAFWAEVAKCDLLCATCHRAEHPRSTSKLRGS